MIQKVISVCIVEDDDEIRSLTKEVLELSENIKCSFEYKNAEDFIRNLDKIKADIVLMDIGLPNMTGTECVRYCTLNGIKLDFVMYTTHFASEEVFDALRSGAKGYILKGGPPERLVQDIYDISEGGSPMSPKISRLVAESFKHEDKSNGDLAKLSKQEWEVLKALDRGLNYKEIASEKFVSAHTVRAQIRSIYEKLHVHNKVDAIKMIK